MHSMHIFFQEIGLGDFRRHRHRTHYDVTVMNDVTGAKTRTFRTANEAFQRSISKEQYTVTRSYDRLISTMVR